MKKSCEEKKSIGRRRGWSIQGAQRATSQVLVVGLFFALSSPALAAQGIASWYDSKSACKFNPTKNCLMANGESIYAAEKEKRLFAASWAYPLGTKVIVKNLKNSRSVVVEIKDRGPAKRLARIIDLGKIAFQKISDLKEGIIKVEVTKL